MGRQWYEMCGLCKVVGVSRNRDKQGEECICCIQV